MFAVYGGPVGIVDRAIESFRPPPRVVDLSDRLRSFSGNGRDQLWSVAWGEFTERPVIGAGAGTYERAWLLEQPADLPVRDAHSLYLETLSELGLVGLVALLAMLGVPAAAALRSRHTPLVPAAFGAYGAYVLHAGSDWDWELAGVTLAAVVCGAALVVAARPEAAPRPRP